MFYIMTHKWDGLLALWHSVKTTLQTCARAMVKNISKHLRPGGFRSSTSLEAWMAGAAGAQHLSSKGSRLRDQWPSWIPAVMGL